MSDPIFPHPDLGVVGSALDTSLRAALLVRIEKQTDECNKSREHVVAAIKRDIDAQPFVAVANHGTTLASLAGSSAALDYMHQLLTLDGDSEREGTDPGLDKITAWEALYRVTYMAGTRSCPPPQSLNRDMTPEIREAYLHGFHLHAFDLQRFANSYLHQRKKKAADSAYMGRAVAFLDTIDEETWKRVCGQQERSEFARRARDRGYGINAAWLAAVKAADER